MSRIYYLTVNESFNKNTAAYIMLRHLIEKLCWHSGKHILHSTVQITNAYAYDTIKGLSAIQHD